MIGPPDQARLQSIARTLEQQGRRSFCRHAENISCGKSPDSLPASGASIFLHQEDTECGITVHVFCFNPRVALARGWRKRYRRVLPKQACRATLERTRESWSGNAPACAPAKRLVTVLGEKREKVESVDFRVVRLRRVAQSGPIAFPREIAEPENGSNTLPKVKRPTGS
jgi:hypothetical protein